MISISTAIYSAAGHVVIQNTEKCDFMDIPSRVSRSATLDGGSVIVHSGVVAGDRTFSINVWLDEAEETILRNIYDNYTSVVVSIHDGVFLGALDSFKFRNGNVTGKILIKSKES
jgi:hypothetical protein